MFNNFQLSKRPIPVAGRVELQGTWNDRQLTLRFFSPTKDVPRRKMQLVESVGTIPDGGVVIEVIPTEKLARFFKRQNLEQTDFTSYAMQFLRTLNTLKKQCDNGRIAKAIVDIARGKNHAVLRRILLIDKNNVKVDSIDIPTHIPNNSSTDHAPLLVGEAIQEVMTKEEHSQTSLPRDTHTSQQAHFHEAAAMQLGARNLPAERIPGMLPNSRPEVLPPDIPLRGIIPNLPSLDVAPPEPEQDKAEFDTLCELLAETLQPSMVAAMSDTSHHTIVDNVLTLAAQMLDDISDPLGLSDSAELERVVSESTSKFQERLIPDRAFVTFETRQIARLLMSHWMLLLHQSLKDCQSLHLSTNLMPLNMSPETRSLNTDTFRRTPLTEAQILRGFELLADRLFEQGRRVTLLGGLILDRMDDGGSRVSC